MDEYGIGFMKNILEVTSRAREKILELLDEGDSSDILGIRVGIKSGGCSGFKYFLEYAKGIHKYDEVIDCGEGKVIIDPKALLYIMGSRMDYLTEEFKEGFVFENPNEKGKCGCGSSFSI